MLNWGRGTGEAVGCGRRLSGDLGEGERENTDQITLCINQRSRSHLSFKLLPTLLGGEDGGDFHVGSDPSALPPLPLLPTFKLGTGRTKEWVKILMMDQIVWKPLSSIAN